MKILFLDIDGVLNSERYCRSVGASDSSVGRHLRRHHPLRVLDPAAVRRLTQLRHGDVVHTEAADQAALLHER